jgi:hypothetical protein
VVNGEGETVHRRLVELRQRGEQFEAVAPGVVLDLPRARQSPRAGAAPRAGRRRCRRRRRRRGKEMALAIHTTDQEIDALIDPRLWIVQDSVGKGIEPEEKVVQYRIRVETLRAAASAGGTI